jgi:diacylglycerol kinase (ATP)
MTQALVLGRRRVGRAIGPAAAEAAKQLEAAGWSVESKVVYKKRELRRETKHAVAAGVDVVVAVGGDGAVLQVVQKLAETKVALGIVPKGTGNLLATNLGIPKGLDEAVQVLLGQRQRVIDVGHVKVAGKRPKRGGKDATKAGGQGATNGGRQGATDAGGQDASDAGGQDATNGGGEDGGKGGGKGGRKGATKDKYFAVACGVGFDAEVMQATAKSRKRQLGKLAYFASVVGQRDKLGNVPHDITIDGNAQTGTATQVFVANFGGMGFGFEPRLEVKPDDGILDVIIVRAAGPVEGLLAGWEAIRQRRRGRTRGGRVYRARAREVRVESTPPRLVEIDGSVIGTTPIDVKIIPTALSVLVPAD